MAKFPEAEARLFRNKFVCRRCKHVLRAPALRFAEGALTCRKCKYADFKPKRTK